MYLSGSLLAGKLRLAIKTQIKQHRLFDDFSKLFKQELLSEWESLVATYERQLKEVWEARGHHDWDLPTVDPYLEELGGKPFMYRKLCSTYLLFRVFQPRKRKFSIAW